MSGLQKGVGEAEMSAISTIYLISVIGNIYCILSLIFILACFATIFCLMEFLMERDDSSKRWLKKMSLFLAIIGLISSLFPGQKSMYLMASTHYLNKTDVPSKVLKALNGKLDKMIEEQKEEKQK
jgi:thiol:disulfide interchange protein